MQEVLNLDIMKPDPRVVTIGGHNIDCSFVPVGATFEIDELFNEALRLDHDKLGSGDREENEKALNLSIRMCAAFCRHSFPDLDEVFFGNNCTAEQVGAFANVITDTLLKSYKGIKASAKNQKASKGKRA